MKSIFNGSILTIALFLFCGVGISQTSAQAAEKEFNRLVTLSKALSKIPINRQDKEPHRSFLKRNDKDIVYSEPAGEWYVRSTRFWNLRKKYATLPIADKIAWTAAENNLPGECEGFVNCYLGKIRMTHGEYLTLYPKGSYSRQAVKQIVEFLKYMEEDVALPTKNLEGPTDQSDRTQFVEVIQELRSILSKVSQPETAKALSQLKLIEKGY